MNGMSITSERLQELRKARGYSQQDVAKLIGVGRTTYLKYESGDNRPTRKLNELARLFNVSADYLLGLTDTPADPAPAQPPVQKVTHYTYRIPVVGRVAAGQPILAQEEIIDYEYIDERLHKGGDQYFGLVVKGSSMEPTIHDGDTIIVRVQETVENGQIAVVLVDGEDATVKEVKESEEGLTLIGHNVAVYTPHFYPNQEIRGLLVRILGKVVEQRGKV